MVDTSGGKVTPLTNSSGGSPYAPDNGYKVTYGYSAPYAGYTQGIVQGTGADWFGPLNPAAPSAPLEVAGRAFDFPSGYNLNLQPRAYEAVGFQAMRSMADAYDVLRLIIETRKDTLTSLNWAIKPRNRPGQPVSQMADPNDPAIKEISEFFEMPDGELAWDQWLREVLEDLMVIDAPTLFCNRTRGGKLHSLQAIDGASIKRVIDDYGRTPAAPVVAYQQILKGLPAVNYTTRDIIYRPRNTRVHKVYGFSPVEQILMTINIAMRRQVYLLQYYTEGNVPEALIGAPENWSMNQIKEFQTWFDSILAGETGMRRRARFVPGGIGKTFINTKEGALTNETDEWLTRICCYAFSVAPTPFVRQVNRATAESQQNQAKEEGSLPLQQWIRNFMNYIIWREWGRRDLEFVFETPASVNSEDQSRVFDAYVRNGAFSINEVRRKLGEDPIEGGDQHMALLPTGWVPIAPTNQFGASGGNEGAGEVDDKVKAKGTSTREGKTPSGGDDIQPPKKTEKVARTSLWERVKAREQVGA